MTNQDRRIKDGRTEIITKIFAECCRFEDVLVQPITNDWGVIYHFKYGDKRLTHCLTNEELYTGKKRAKYSDYYIIGDSIRQKLSIPPDLTINHI